MAQSRTYSLGTATITQLEDRIESFLRTLNDMEVQSVQGTDGYLIQARKRGGQWRQFVGMDTAIQVRVMSPEPGMVTVDVGQGKWIDKLGVGVAGLWVWPLLVTAGFGAASQLKLGHDILSQVETFLSLYGGR